MKTVKTNDSAKFYVSLLCSSTFGNNYTYHLKRKNYQVSMPIAIVYSKYVYCMYFMHIINVK